MGEIVGAGRARARPDHRAARRRATGAQQRAASRRSTRACTTSRREVFDALRPDLVVVFDSHWFTTVEFVVTAARASKGPLHLRGAAPGHVERPLRHPGRPRVRARSSGAWPTRRGLLDHADRRRAPARSTTPTINFLGFLQGDERWVVGQRPARPAETGDFAHRRRVRRRARRPSSTCASCSSAPARSATRSGRCATLRDHEAAGEEHIFTQEAARADHRASSSRWSRGDHAAVIDDHARVPDLPARGPLRPLPDDGRGPRGRGVHRAGARVLGVRELDRHRLRSTSWFDRPEGGWTA